MKRTPMHAESIDAPLPIRTLVEVGAILRARYPGEPWKEHQVRYLDDMACSKFVAGIMSAIFGNDWDGMYGEMVEVNRVRKRAMWKESYRTAARLYNREWTRRKRKETT